MKKNQSNLFCFEFYKRRSDSNSAQKLFINYNSNRIKNKYFDTNFLAEYYKNLDFFRKIFLVCISKTFD